LFAVQLRWSLRLVLNDIKLELVDDVSSIRYKRPHPGALFFTPYHGTRLRDIAVKKGYLNADSICSLNVTDDSILDMPQFSADEIRGLARVFSFYVKMPEERWPEIRHAETDDAAFRRIWQDFNATYWPSQTKPTHAYTDLHS